MAHHFIHVAVIWLAYIGVVGTAGAAGGSPRAVSAIATGGVFLATIGTLLVLFA
jgi:hypothetical protein